MGDDEGLWEASKVAEMLCCSADHVVNLHRSGKLPAVPIGVRPPRRGQPGPKSLRFLPSDVRAFVAAQRVIVLPEGEEEHRAAPAAAPVGAAAASPAGHLARKRPARGRA